MSFANASNIEIQNANFTENNNNIHIPIRRKTLSPVRNVPPSTSQNFTGQEEYLEKLHNHFVKNESKNRKMYLLYGMGGIGKTQICLKFKDDVSSIYAYIFWIDATSNDTIDQCLKDIYKLKMLNISDGISYSSSLVLHWIATLETNWFMIFDNADGSPEIVENNIPPGNNGNILITSRNPAHKRIVSPENSEEILVMGKETAIELLLKSSGLRKDAEKHYKAATDIAGMLFYLPLAIDQAGAYINAGKCKIDKYRSMYEKYRPKLMTNKNFRGASKYNQTVYGTWEISFQKIQDMTNDEDDEDKAMSAKYALNLINMCAFFHHENISDEIFERAANNYSGHVRIWKDKPYPTFLPTIDKSLLNRENDNTWNEMVYRESIEILLSFSMITRSVDNSKFSMHPLVQIWCQDRLQHIERNLWIINSRAIISSSITLEITTSEFLYKDRILLLHALQNLSHGYQNETPCYVDISHILGKILFEMSKFAEIEMLTNQTYDMIKKILGEEHPDTLMSMADLAMTYGHLMKYRDAEKIERDVLEKILSILGEDHPETLMSMNNLAATYCNLGKYADAELLGIQVVEKRKKILGEEHPDTLMSMAHLAVTYGHLMKYRDAEKIERDVLEKRLKILGEDHPETLMSMNNLAATYRYLEKYADAELLGIQVVEKIKKILGEEHPNTLMSMAQLAVTYKHLMKYRDAETIEIDVLEKRLKILGEDHPETLMSMNNLAATYRYLEKYADAELLGIQVVEKRKKILGEEHQDTLMSMAHLAVAYGHLMKYSDAEKIERDVLEEKVRILGEDHPSTLMSMANLEWTYKHLGKFADAELLGIQVVEKRKKILGEEHPDTLMSMAHVVDTYVNNCKFSEAETLGTQVLNSRIKVLGKDHTDTILTMHNLAVTYFSLEKYVDAEHLQVQVVNTASLVLAKNHEHMLIYVNRLREIYKKLGKWEEAAALYNEYYKLEEDSDTETDEPSDHEIDNESVNELDTKSQYDNESDTESQYASCYESEDS